LRLYASGIGGAARADLVTKIAEYAADFICDHAARESGFERLEAQEHFVDGRHLAQLGIPGQITILAGDNLAALG
jgi:hypothetical protein